MTAHAHTPLPAPPSPLQFTIWRDFFVAIDDCTANAAVYERLQQIAEERSAKHATGLGCLMIVPPTAKAPSDDVRWSMAAALASLSVRCVCWLVEGSGFQGAMVRGVLTGLCIVAHPKFSTHIATNLEEAVTWMLPRLDGGWSRLAHARVVTSSIRAQRELGLHIVV